MRVSVGIASWNRAALLEGAIEGLFRATVPDRVDLEILVIDNGSTDETPEVLRRHEGARGFVGLREEKPGKSNALNLAASAASGDYLIWIDDDIRVSPSWLECYVAAFRANPSAVVFGGSIKPDFQGSPPTWLLEGLSEIGGIYGLCEPDEGPITLDGPFLPFGGNMAVRRDVQLRYRYDPELGRRHGQLLAGEESTVVRRILEDGGVGQWVPSARVKHLIPTPMQSLAHVRRYYHDYGASFPAMDGGPRRRIPGAWVFRDAVEQEIRYRVGRALRRPATSWLRSLCLASFAQGIIRSRPMRVR